MGKCPLLLGHRGARAVKSIPENTLASFDLALAHGCDGFEFDVRLTADGAPVIAHDPAIRGIEIAKASAADLSTLPRLGDVLDRYQHSAFLDIELKVAGLEKIIAALLHDCTLSRGYVVSSFLPEVLRAMHGEDPNVPLGYICDEKARLNEWHRLPIHYLFLHHRLASRSLMQQLCASPPAGPRVMVWTVNQSVEMKRFAKFGVDGIISDETEKLVRLLGAQKK